MKKKWELIDADLNKVNEIANEFDIPELIAKVLVDRGVTEKEQVEMYLNPTRENFHNPFMLPDMEAAVNEIMIAIKEKKKVIIYGDYDVDGITSITVLKKFLEERGLSADYYIPNRLDEGYGLNKSAIEKIAQERL